MIIQELAYKITVKADEFLNGKKKVEEGAKELGDNVTKEFEGIGVAAKTTGNEVAKTGDAIQKTNKKTGKSFSDTAFDIKNFTTAATSSFRGVTVAAAGFGYRCRALRYQATLHVHLKRDCPGQQPG
jgi:hypothetical protein